MVEKPKFHHDPALKAGDIVFTAGNSILSRLIRWASRGWGESKTKVNHIGVITTPGSLLTADITEALWKVRTHNLYRRYSGGRNKVCIVRAVGIPPHILVKIAARAESYTGRKYGWWKLGLHFGDKLLGGVYFFRRLSFLKKRPICSFVVAEAWAHFGYTFGVPYGGAQPDDIWDFIMYGKDYVVIRTLREL